MTDKEDAAAGEWMSTHIARAKLNCAKHQRRETEGEKRCLSNGMSEAERVREGADSRG